MYVYVHMYVSLSLSLYIYIYVSLVSCYNCVCCVCCLNTYYLCQVFAPGPASSSGSSSPGPSCLGSRPDEICS